jgi:hypothetical protein
VTDRLKRKYSVPNLTVLPDWDLVEAIVKTIQEANLTVSISFIKGHQDNDTPYAQLPFSAQLNVDADQLAGRFQENYSSYRPLIPLSPTRPVALDITNPTINCHFKSLIRDASHSGPLISRKIAINGWDISTPNWINWETHHLSTSVHRPNHTHFVKLCHGYLPAGKIVHQNNPSFSHHCPLCHHPQEDHHHILWCPHPGRTKWRKDLKKKLTDKCSVLQTDTV